MTPQFTALAHTVTTGKTLATIEHEGFTIAASVEIDEFADLSFYGAFANEHKGEFSISHEPNNSRTFNWFNPENVSNMKEARQNYDRARTYGESWEMLGSIVTVSKAGVELGSASIWGTESDSDAAHFLELLNDLIPEALEEARAKLNELKAA